MHTNTLFKFTGRITLLIAVVFVSACVSDTLSNVDTKPQPLAAEKPPSYDPIQREQAVSEIRAKAEQAGGGELTNPYAEADGPNQPLTPEEQAAKIAELESSAAQNNAVSGDAELEAKQRSIKELQKKAKSHYGNAVKQIKN